MWTPVAVRELRTRLGLDQAGFARLLNVDARSVHRWEAGRSTPTASADAVMTAMRETLERDPDGADQVIKFILGATAVGGLAYLLVKLFESLKKRS